MQKQTKSTTKTPEKTKTNPPSPRTQVTPTLRLVRGPGLGRVGLRDGRAGRGRGGAAVVVLGERAGGLGAPVVEAGPVLCVRV